MRPYQSQPFLRPHTNLASVHPGPQLTPFCCDSKQGSQFLLSWHTPVYPTRPTLPGFPMGHSSSVHPISSFSSQKPHHTPAASCAPKSPAPSPPPCFCSSTNSELNQSFPSAERRAARRALLSFVPHLLGNKELGLIYKNILDAVFSSSGLLLSSCPR